MKEIGEEGKEGKGISQLGTFVCVEGELPPWCVRPDFSPFEVYVRAEHRLRVINDFIETTC